MLWLALAQCFHSSAHSYVIVILVIFEWLLIWLLFKWIQTFRNIYSVEVKCLILTFDKSHIKCNYQLVKMTVLSVFVHLSVSVCLCLSVCLSVCLSACLSVSVCLSVCLCLSVCRSVYVLCVVCACVCRWKMWMRLPLKSQLWHGRKRDFEMSCLFNCADKQLTTATREIVFFYASNCSAAVHTEDCESL